VSISYTTIENGRIILHVVELSPEKEEEFNIEVSQRMFPTTIYDKFYTMEEINKLKAEVIKKYLP